MRRGAVLCSLLLLFFLWPDLLGGESKRVGIICSLFSEVEERRRHSLCRREMRIRQRTAAGNGEKASG